MELSKIPLIIAEAGVNHNGSLETALKMVDSAAQAGADYIKFQTFKTENLVKRDAAAANYQKTNCGAVSQFEMLKSLELKESDFKCIAEYCKKKNIGFLSTPFDHESLEFLLTLDMDFIKVSSGDLTNYPLLRLIARSNLPTILSTGMAEIWEIKDAIDIFKNEGFNCDNLFLLHCTTQYPTPYADVNLNVIPEFVKEFGLKTGYSDHTVGIEVSIAAVAIGAVILEKHFTLDKKMSGPDHAASLDPEELKLMVNSLRKVEIALGSNLKHATESEKENIKAARKSIVAAKRINKGELFSENNLAVKRPGSGMSPMCWNKLIGTSAKHDYEADDLIIEEL